MKMVAKLMKKNILAAIVSSLMLCTSAMAQEAIQIENIDLKCEALDGEEILASQIGLATQGAKVTSVKYITAEMEGNQSMVSHCLVNGDIMPMDQAAPNIKFKIALPQTWNHKMAMFGGGGLNGVIPKISEIIGNAFPTIKTPIQRGYAVFASDSGHQSDSPNPAIDGRFLVNDEAHKNWQGDALKKTRDVSQLIVEKFYQTKANKAYFIGESTGGREGLTVAARWPEDWDGVVALYPARPTALNYFALNFITQTLSAQNAYLGLPERNLLKNSVNAICDGLDGVEDGLISNVKECYAKFNPETAIFEGKLIKCTIDGQNETCLTDKQIQAIQKLDEPTPLGFELANGDTHFPGYNIYTSDTGTALDNQLAQIVTILGFGIEPATSPLKPTAALSAGFAAAVDRYLIAKNPELDFLTLDLTSDDVKMRLQELSKLDVVESDLQEFAKKGGKLLMMHGTDDLLISPRLTREYLRGLKKNLGDDLVNSFVKYYEIPGFAHGVSIRYLAVWDYLTALENWVQEGVEPENQVTIDLVGVQGRTRPLCSYPNWAKYTGEGDVNVATSFICAAE